ncbi:YitT family protein [Sporosarcina sp. G11-34]|uniref:YitT family protein n=1 Tax=Sporosarcina sp. G11-34 TaxID=2849605 RepID=UPI0022A94040|nr:YitT family protein [Sporosarcina sp. G11-34]MCZ2257898.1 YitT family protein [Sporosarcina sp. G11-34]
MELFKKTLIIFIGCFFIAVGINLFLVPFRLLEGGALGISLVIHYLTGVKVGFTFLLISIPIFIFAWVFYRSFFYNGIHGMLISSIMIDVFYPLHILGENLMMSPFLSAALGGVFIGSGVGVMFRFDISMGGLDLLGQMLARKLALNPGVVIFCIDLVIVSVGCMLIVSSHLLLSYTTVFFVGVTTSLIVSKQGRRRTSYNDV